MDKWRIVRRIGLAAAALALVACGASSQEASSVSVTGGSNQISGEFRVDVSSGTSNQVLPASSAGQNTVMLGPFSVANSSYPANQIAYSVSITVVDPGEQVTDMTDVTPASFQNASGGTVHAAMLMMNVTYRIVVRATEPGGRSAQTNPYSIMVQDLTPPVITGSPMGDQVVQSVATMGDPTAVVNIGAPTATDNVDGVLALGGSQFSVAFSGVTSNPPLVGVNTYTLPVGTTVATYTATDNAGNTATYIQRIIVVDGLTVFVPNNTAATARQIEALGPMTQLTRGMLAGPDTNGIPAEIVVAGGLPPYTIANNVPQVAPQGLPVSPTAVVITWTVTDSVGMVGTAMQYVVIRDTTPPAFTNPPLPTINVTQLTPGVPQQVNLFAPAVTDIVDNPFPNQNITNDAPNPPAFDVGTYTITWTATDSAGNTATETQQIVVSPPAVACSTLVASNAQGDPEFEDVYTNVLRPLCQGCHNATGGGQFHLIGDGVDQQLLAQDFQSFRSASLQLTGASESEMLAKPTGRVSHSGGGLLTDPSPDYDQLAILVPKVLACVGDTVDPTGLEVGTYYTRLRRATLALAGRLPTAAEEANVNGSTNETDFDTRFTAILDAIMASDPGFYGRLKEIFNDLLLTDKYANRDNPPTDNFDLGNYANETFFDDLNNPEQRNANYGFARAPLELIADVVRNNQPFTDILTANYTMVNPYSATVMNVSPAAGFRFDTTNNVANHDPDDFRRVTGNQDNNGNVIPHSGILTTTAFLARYPTTNTNVNRHRAGIVLGYFLGTDVEALANRADLDLDNVISSNPTYDNPARGLGDPQCIICHNTVDPIAGLFKNWSGAGAYMGDSAWFGPMDRGNNSRMLDPGITAKPIGQPQTGIIPGGRTADAVRWMAEDFAAQDRFLNQVRRLMFRAYTGQELPSGTPDSDAIRLSFTLQSGADLKDLIKAIIKSSYFRAINLDPSRDPANYADVGMGRLIIPEQLQRKVQAVLNGYDWRGPSTNRGLTDQTTYNLFYGGIDSNEIVTRTTQPTALMIAIQERIANQGACQNVALDFNRPQASRVLFPMVTLNDVPDNGAGTAAIRNNIQYLHKQILGEEITNTDPEIDRAYQLFLSVRAQNNTTLPNACRNGGITSDATRTVLPWMAVISYMLSDYKFLFE